jgi:hypothetical protein
MRLASVSLFSAVRPSSSVTAIRATMARMGVLVACIVSILTSESFVTLGIVTPPWLRWARRELAEIESGETTDGGPIFRWELPPLPEAIGEITRENANHSLPFPLRH